MLVAAPYTSAFKASVCTFQSENFFLKKKKKEVCNMLRVETGMNNVQQSRSLLFAQHSVSLGYSTWKTEALLTQPTFFGQHFKWRNLPMCLLRSLSLCTRIHTYWLKGIYETRPVAKIPCSCNQQHYVFAVSGLELSVY